jgi:hypothetical protein
MPDEEGMKLMKELDGAGWRWLVSGGGGREANSYLGELGH